MIRIVKLIPIISITLLFSCNSKKSASDAEKNISSEKMVEEGYKEARLIASKNENCPHNFIIKGQENTPFDPINLDASYKEEKSGTKFWIKYTPLRMPNRCEIANPIEITAIVKDK